MSEAPQAMPTPTAEHAALHANVGVWNVACTFYMDPSEPPLVVQARDTVESFGPFWITSDFEADMLGMPFKGRASLGYDPRRGIYESTWYDTLNPHLFVLRGKVENDVLAMSGQAPSPVTGELTTYRTTERKDGGKRIFEMFMELPGGGEWKMFTHVYSRA